LLIRHGKDPKSARVLVMGITFKENVADIRNSKVADLVRTLKEFSIQVDVIDPHADSEEVMHEYGFGLAKAASGKYDAAVVAVAHNEYKAMPIGDLRSLLSPDMPILMDIKNLYSAAEKADLISWSL
jgi:UDP-N-acetyl-D-glucosamine/UDP-N-acetyl-D-galactosamine dehydrogenase